MGPKTLRALALTTEVVMGASPSFTDPVSFSFAHGGKDGIPFPVDRETYQETIEFLPKWCNVPVLRLSIRGKCMNNSSF